jgi:predicted nucleic acid-binding protein
MSVCPDASFVLAWFVPTRRSAAVSDVWRQLLRRGDQLIAPPLLYAEVTSVLRRYAATGALTAADTLAAVRHLFRIPISTVHKQLLYERALELAERLGQHKAYDSQYVATADLEGCALFTLDEGLYNSARRLGIEARLIA